MNKLNPQNQLFLKLEKNKPKWWNNLISNKDIYIDIRKDNYIDIYIIMVATLYKVLNIKKGNLQVQFITSTCYLKNQNTLILIFLNQ